MNANKHKYLMEEDRIRLYLRSFAVKYYDC